VPRALCFVLVLTLAGRAAAQEYPRRDLNPRELAQNLLPVPTQDVDYAEAGEALYQLFLQPLDLNTCTADDLAALYVLDERQLASFLAYRAQLGPLASVYELQAVPGFDLPLIYRLLPFVEVRDAQGLTLRPDRQNFLLLRAECDLEPKRGYQPAEPGKNGLRPQRYLGDPSQLYARLKFYGKKGLEGGFTLEKDPGEQLVFDPATRRYGPDFISAHLLLRNRGRWKALTVGDYQLQFGQGLVLAGGFFLGKGSETVLTTRRSHLGIRPYTSATEWGMLRGAAATYQAGRWELTPFVSRLRRDANLADDSTATADPTGSLQTSGLHRTPNELADRGQVAQQDLGLNALWRSPNNRAQVGATLLQTIFDATIQKSDRPYNRYEFSGKSNLLVGVQGNYLWRNATFFGEAARSQSGGVGVVGGALASLGRRWDASVVFRHYDRNFHSLHGQAFSENSRDINETGLYLGWKFTPSRRWQLGGYLDAFRFPWLKYLVDQPSRGWGGLLRAAWVPRKTTQAWAQVVQEVKEKNIPNRLQKADEVVGTVRRYVVLGFDHAPRRGLSLSSRAFYSSFRYAGFRPSQGWGLVQDASVSRKNWTFTGRTAYFNTDDYDSRFYSYENDVLYAFSLPAYFYEGFRHYLLVQYRLSRALDLWLRVARTDYLNRQTVGSGLDQIDASHRTEVKMQVRWRF
jgi:hypothetical protein